MDTIETLYVALLNPITRWYTLTFIIGVIFGYLFCLWRYHDRIKDYPIIDSIARCEVSPNNVINVKIQNKKIIQNYCTCLTQPNLVCSITKKKCPLAKHLK